MNSKYLLLLIPLLLIGSAFALDASIQDVGKGDKIGYKPVEPILTWHSYDTNTKTASIGNWLGIDKVADIKLIDNTDICLIDCSAIIEITPSKDFDIPTELNFIDRKGNEKAINYKTYVLQTEDYKAQVPYTYDDVCQTPIIDNKTNKTTYKEEKCTKTDYKTEEATREVWIETDLSNIKFSSGEPIQIKIEGHKGITESIDWLPTIYGQTIDEMAWWNSSWQYKNQLNISSVTYTKVDYPIFVNMTFPTGKMNANCSDLRIVDSIETNEYTYNLSSCNATYLTFYFIANITASSNLTTYVYYGNVGASSTSVSFDPYAKYEYFNTSAGRDDYDDTNGASRYGGQAIRIGVTGANQNFTLYKLAAFVGDGGTVASADVSYEVYGADASGHESGGILGNASITETLNGWQWKNYTFQTLANLTESTNYTIAHKASSASGVNVWGWIDAGGYGGAVASQHSFVWQSGYYDYSNGRDAYFELFGRMNPETVSTFGAEESNSLAVNLNLPADATTIYDTQNYNFNFTAVSSTDTSGINCSIYLNSTLNQTNASVVNNTLTNFNIAGITYGSHSWYVNCTDSVTSTISATRTFSILNTTPIITITSPTNITYNTNPVLMNFTAITNGTMDQMTGYFPEIPYSTFNCNTSGNTSTCLTNRTFTDGQHQLVAYAVSTNGKTATSNVYFFVDTTPPAVTLISPNGAYPNSTTALPFFCNATDNIGLVNSTFWWDFGGTWVANGTETITGTSNSTTFARTFNLTNQINWNCMACDDASNCAFAPANYSIFSLPFNISAGSCPAGLTAAQNYTFKDENDLTPLSNVNIAANFQFGNAVNNSLEIYNTSLSGISNFSICINASYAPYYVGYGEIDYSISGYASRHYYLFVNSTLTNTTQNIILYALRSNPYQSTSQSTSYYNTTTNITTTNTSQLQTTGDYATAFQFTFMDSALNAYTGDYARLLRWYPASGQYNPVDAGISDGNGQTVMYVAQNSVDYRVALYYPNGTLLKLADPSRFTCSGTPCTYTLRISSVGNYLSDFGVQHSLTFSNTTKMFTFTWNDPSGTTTNMSFVVNRIDGANDYEVCNSYMASPTGALSCNISGYSSGTFSAVAYRTASPESPIDALMETLTSTIFRGQMGLFVSFLLMIVMIFVGIYSPVAAILLAVLSLIPALAFGVITPAIFIGIGALGAMIIHVFKRVS